MQPNPDSADQKAEIQHTEEIHNRRLKQHSQQCGTQRFKTNPHADKHYNTMKQTYDTDQQPGLVTQAYIPKILWFFWGVGSKPI